jgi:hypothetical protein
LVDHDQVAHLPEGFVTSFKGVAGAETTSRDEHAAACPTTCLGLSGSDGRGEVVITWSVERARKRTNDERM